MVSVRRRVVDLDGEGERGRRPRLLIFSPYEHGAQEHQAGVWVERHVGVGEPGDAGEENGIFPASGPNALLMKAIQILGHGLIKGRETGVISGVQTVHVVGDRIQDRIFRMDLVIVSQLPLSVVGHAEFPVPVDRSGHCPGEGGIKAQLVFPEEAEKGADGQRNRKAVAAVQREEIFKDSPAAPSFQRNGVKQGNVLLPAQWAEIAMYSIRQVG